MTPDGRGGGYYPSSEMQSVHSTADWVVINLMEILQLLHQIIVYFCQSVIDKTREISRNQLGSLKTEYRNPFLVEYI